MNKRDDKFNETISRQECDILLQLKHNPFSQQRGIAEMSGHSIGVVNKCIKNLKNKGLIDEDNRITEPAKALFEANAPQNAIILAAGYGMRMVPINLSAPKALLEVNSEKLIERVIDQLHDVGIYDITVVAGFMKETLEYLIDEKNVEIVINQDYKTSNNMYSLDMVKHKIGNTYIVPSDIWCADNPFNNEELYSWYMVSDQNDNQSDVRVNRKMQLVRVANNDDGNKMIGIAYLTTKDAGTIRDNMAELVSSDKKHELFWEEALYDGDRMLVNARLESSEKVVEINTYEQLRDLDANSIQLKSHVLQTICKVFGCDEDSIIDIEVLKKGMTNRSFKFRISNGENAGKYIMRIPGEGTDQLIDRVAEASVYKTISGHLLCDDPVYINPDNGYKITKYIEDVRCCDPENEHDLKLCMRKLRKFHGCMENGKPLTVSHCFDLFERIDFYESLWDGKPSVYKDYEKTKEKCTSLLPFIEKNRGEMQLTHIDAVPDNFLFDPNAKGELSIQLTDWEYAGMQDKHVDIAMFCIYSLYNKEQVDRLIDIYFEEDGGCNKVIRAKIYAYIAICGLLWSNWCEYKRNLGVEFGAYSLYQYRYAKDYYRYALELIND